MNDLLFRTEQTGWDGRERTEVLPPALPGDAMRHTLLALALAAASLALTTAGHAGTSYGEGYYGQYQQTCVTKRIRTTDAYGRTITKRVRICR